jgi:hypothetical protein
MIRVLIFPGTFHLFYLCQAVTIDIFVLFDSQLSTFLVVPSSHHTELPHALLVPFVIRGSSAPGKSPVSRLHPHPLPIVSKS